MRALRILALVAVSATPPAAASRLEALPAADGVRVHVFKRGLFSAFAHDHDFQVTRWRGTADLPDGDAGRAAVELVLAADSLRDRHPGLSSGDRREVDARAAGPEVLDAAHHPEIGWRSESVRLAPDVAGGALRGTARGSLTLRGRTRPVEVAFEAEREGEGWRVRGRATFKQSDFGIEPFSGFGGTVGVKDEVEVTYTLVLRRPAAPPRAAGDLEKTGAGAAGR
jgi:polyisoprenoid-binding protein YceI